MVGIIFLSVIIPHIISTINEIKNNYNIMKNIHFHNKKLLQEKIEEIKLQGLEKLHLVSDFDRTLTKCFHKGKKISSGIGLIREGGYLSKDYDKKAHELFNKYHPIEMDESLDYDFRYKKMDEWWKTHRGMLVEYGMHKKIIEDVTKKHPKTFREGTFEFFDTLHTQNIPLLIFSAGLGDLIKESLKRENKLTPNVHILSNDFIFNDEGRAIGYKDRTIHVLNKSEEQIKDKQYKNLVAERNNVILLGDLLGDLGMVNDLDANLIIKIGFLNENIEDRLELFINKFDVVITHDGTMEYVNELLRTLSS